MKRSFGFIITLTLWVLTLSVYGQFFSFESREGTQDLYPYRSIVASNVIKFFESLPPSYPMGSFIKQGYCTSNVTGIGGFDNHEVCNGTRLNVAINAKAYITVWNSKRYRFRYGPDFIVGTALMDGIPISTDSNIHEHWYYNDWTEPCVFYWNSTLSPGCHILDVYTVKNCCDTRQSIQFDNFDGKGYRDLNIDNWEDGCSNRRPCMNGGRCVLSPCPSCVCSSAFTGYNCSIDVNECATNNGGCSEKVLCTNTYGGFRCGKCPSGYMGNGTVCTEINECDSSPCNNGGTCYDQLNAFSCSCLPSFFGSTCQFRKLTFYNSSSSSGLSSSSISDSLTSSSNSSVYDYCNSHPCANGGSCSMKVTQIVCSCPQNYTGTFCQTKSSDAKISVISSNNIVPVIDIITRNGSDYLPSKTIIVQSTVITTQSTNERPSIGFYIGIGAGGAMLLIFVGYFIYNQCFRSHRT